jgi:hypothetical protein
MPKTHPRRNVRAELHEQFNSDKSSVRVDRNAGVIRGCRVLGRVSSNTHGVKGAKRTEYTLQAIKEAAPLYSGAVVNRNHPPREKPYSERKAEERIGWLENVQVRDDGLYADLHLLKSDPLTDKLMEAAERNPRLFALSHNAYGAGDLTADGTYRITSIPEVRSVDVVADGGTNASLFESKSNRNKRGKPMRSLTREWEDTGEKSSKDMAKEGFLRMCQAVHEGDDDTDTKLSKLKELYKMHEALMGDDEVEEGDEDNGPNVGRLAAESRRTFRRPAGSRRVVEFTDFGPVVKTIPSDPEGMLRWLRS